MKLLEKEKTLCLEFPEMVECMVEEKKQPNMTDKEIETLRKKRASYLSKAHSVGTKGFVFIENLSDKRSPLISYESLKPKYKELVKNVFGDPYEYMAKEPIKEMVIFDTNAEAYYLDYRYEGNKTLPAEHIKSYSWSASWLNMINEAMKDKKSLKKNLNLTIDQFYTHVIELIKLAHLPLPTSYRRLVVNQDSALKKYLNEGYGTLIDWRFGNKNTAKIKDELAESILHEMIAHGNQYDDVFITQQYNTWAKEAGYKEIKAATVGHHRRVNDAFLITEREGQAAFNDQYLKKVKRSRPSSPLFMVESDDNHLDLLYIDLAKAGRSFEKYKAIIVIDSYNDYVLGYAYGLEIKHNLVHAAYLNAMYHLKIITGNWVLPHEIKTDRWALKTLTPFYESLGKYIPTPVGSKGRGYIEQFFGTPHWKRCIKVGANNYSGNNLTARNRGVNTELLNANYKERPAIGNEATTQIENFFHRLRYMPTGENKPSKHDQWMDAWGKLDEDKKRIITDEQFLLKFGVEHNYRNEGIRISNKGVQPQINGVKYNYDLSEYHLEHIGKAVSVIYDPYDMSRVLLTDHANIRVMAHEARLVAPSIMDHNGDSREYLNAIFQEKKDLQGKVSNRTEKRKNTLNDSFVDAEAVLQSGFMIKESKQAAEQQFIEQTNKTKNLDDDNFSIYDQM